MNELLDDVLCGPERVLPGSDLDDEQLLAAAREVFHGRQYRVVREWMILDVTGSEEFEQLVSLRGLQPVTLFAQRMLFDSTGLKQGGVWLSGFMRAFEDCYFEAEEVVYVLGGRGARKQVSMPALRELSKRCSLLRRRATSTTVGPG